MKVLISTYGFDERKVVAAMSKLAYDKLLLVAGDDVLETQGYLRLKKMESLGPSKMETVTVDVHDFRDCLDKVDRAIRKWDVEENSVVLNISGGTVILADAALLAGYHNGVEIYHVDEKVTKLPVIKGMKVSDRFTERQALLIKALEADDTIPKLAERLKNTGIDEQAVRREVRMLSNEGVIGQRLEKGQIRLDFNEGQEWFKRFL
ncbi:MAG: hypothetical protein KAS60_08490 [Thermoplasmata archaeon]|nr:DUF6293 family protein [Candidatus Thermoplasmatota archaeon]MCK4950109.1 hypothetical protein [Thermoplasmata archaeon]